jgi:hypothetical protein
MTAYFQLCLLATALLAAGGCAATSSTQNGTGVVAVAPRLVDLGADWTEREIAFAVDPLDQPPETVNEAASRDQTNRRALLAQVKAGMESEGAAG